MSSFLHLERFAYTPWGTFGRLIYGDNRFFSVERPWQNNEPRVSCIPEGRYKVVWYNSPRFGRTLAVVGGTVSLFPDNRFKRSAILFHTANTIDDILGCIGLGKSLGWVNNKWAITSSQLATNEFLSLNIPENTELLITQYIP
jgi:hypothetical protein